MNYNKFNVGDKLISNFSNMTSFSKGTKITIQKFRESLTMGIIYTDNQDNIWHEEFLLTNFALYSKAEIPQVNYEVYG